MRVGQITTSLSQISKKEESKIILQIFFRPRTVTKTWLWTMIREAGLCRHYDSNYSSNRKLRSGSMNSCSRHWSRTLRKGISTMPFSDHLTTPAIKARINLEKAIHSFWEDRKWVRRPAKVVKLLSMLRKEDRIVTISSKNPSANSIAMIKTRRVSISSTTVRNFPVRHLRVSIMSRQVSRARGTRIIINNSNSESPNKCKETSQLIKWKELIMLARVFNLFLWPKTDRRSALHGVKIRLMMITIDSPKSPRSRAKIWGRVHFCRNVRSSSSTPLIRIRTRQWWTILTRIKGLAVKIEGSAIIHGLVTKTLTISIWL